MRVVPYVVTERGTTANHHYTDEGLIGDRVKMANADGAVIFDDNCSLNVAMKWREIRALFRSVP